MKDNNNVQTVEEMFSRIPMDDDAIKYIEKMCDDIKMLKEKERTLIRKIGDGGARQYENENITSVQTQRYLP